VIFGKFFFFLLYPIYLFFKTGVYRVLYFSFFLLFSPHFLFLFNMLLHFGAFSFGGPTFFFSFRLYDFLDSFLFYFLVVFFFFRDVLISFFFFPTNTVFLGPCPILSGRIRRSHVFGELYSSKFFLLFFFEFFKVCVCPSVFSFFFPLVLLLPTYFGDFYLVICVFRRCPLAFLPYLFLCCFFGFIFSFARDFFRLYSPTVD